MNTNLQVVTQILRKEAQNGFSKGNLVMSPSLLEVSLCMVAAGAKGKTLEQLLSFLGMKSVDEVHIKSTSLKVIGLISNNENESSENSTKLCFISGVWVDKRFPLVPSYTEVLNKVYKAEAKSVDFLNQGDKVIEEVNSWVYNATRGLINQILSPQALEIDTLLILANALYYKGAWARGFQFNSSMTKNRDFHLLTGNTVSVPCMTSRRNNHFFGHFNGCKTLKIPYEKGCDDLIKFSMYFFLPDEEDGLKSLIEKFNADIKLFDQHFNLKVELLDGFWIPKFKFSYESDAEDTMKELGLDLPFMAVKELTGIVDSPYGDELYVKKIIQKSFIEIDEEGTEAAACYSIQVGGGYGPPPPRPSFMADHPFMFMIREDTSGALLFVGAVLNPQR